MTDPGWARVKIWCDAGHRRRIVYTAQVATGQPTLVVPRTVRPGAPVWEMWHPSDSWRASGDDIHSRTAIRCACGLNVALSQQTIDGLRAYAAENGGLSVQLSALIAQMTT